MATGFKWLAVGFSAALALAACKPAAHGGDDVLHVGSQRGGTKAVMLASGVLDNAPYKVEWAEFAAAQPLLEAIGAGAVDVGVTGDAPFVFAYLSGSPVKAVAAQYVETRPTGALVLMVPAGSRARSLADLKGAKVATTRGSVGHYLVIRALQEAKLPSDWVQITFLSPGDARAAFDSGAIDGWATWSPYVKPAIDHGARIIADGATLVRGYGFDVANEKSIAAKRAILADFVAREAKALRWAQRNRETYAAVLSRETGLPIDVARDYAQKNGRTIVPIDQVVITDQQQVIENFRKAGAATGDRPIRDAFDATLVATPAGARPAG